MDYLEIILAAAIVGGTGLFIGIFLGIAGKKFAVEVDPRESAIMNVLPGNNCGGCGYPGCAALAGAIVEGKAEPSACPVGGSDTTISIGQIMGKEVGEVIPMTAFLKCSGTCEQAKTDYTYYGVKDCNAMTFMQNLGPKSCDFGCYGLGTCMKACPFDAISIVDGIAVVNEDACMACGKCVEACPKHLMELVPISQKQRVLCSSHNKGKEVMNACSAGCIGCMLCVKVCEFDAIVMENNVAHIQPDKCTGCGKCAEKCPKKCISR